MVKVARGMAEDARVRVRGVRREAMEKIKSAEKGGSITEDDQKLYEKDVQKMTDASITKIDQTLEKKEGEIMTV
jgi:ribosome recycling factor